MKRILRSICGVTLGLFVLSISAFGNGWGNPGSSITDVDLPNGFELDTGFAEVPLPANEDRMEVQIISTKSTYLGDGRYSTEQSIWSLVEKEIDGVMEMVWEQHFVSSQNIDSSSSADGSYSRTSSIVTEVDGTESLRVTETWAKNGETFEQWTFVVALDGTTTVSHAKNYDYSGSPRKLRSVDTQVVQVEGLAISWPDMEDRIAGMQVAEGMDINAVAEMYNIGDAGKTLESYTQMKSQMVYDHQDRLIGSLTVTNDETSAVRKRATFFVYTAEGDSNDSISVGVVYVGEGQ
ncbi:MAG: hypothetical protein P9X27_06685 [Candidatus Kaelpia aquatica]|nr:hypothetical protein [Candidatus Kaelpia aquatica]